MQFQPLRFRGGQPALDGELKKQLLDEILEGAKCWRPYKPSRVRARVISLVFVILITFVGQAEQLINTRRSRKSLSKGWPYKWANATEELKPATTHKMEKPRLCCTQEAVDEYMRKLGEISLTNKYHPSMIFNYDEMGMAKKKGKYLVYVGRECQTAWTIDEGDSTNHISFLVCIVADGTILKTQVILPMQKLPEDCIGTREEFLISGTDKGWATRVR